MFDYGAVAVQEILEENKEFGLKDALMKIQKRPWLYDGIDKWLERMKVTLENTYMIHRESN